MNFTVGVVFLRSSIVASPSNGELGSCSTILDVRSFTLPSAAIELTWIELARAQVARLFSRSMNR